MTNSQRLATVRACLLGWLATERSRSADANGASQPAIVREAILIRNEFYCGRRFHTDTHQAIWFIEEDELKIYRDGGELICVLSSQQIDDQVRQMSDHGQAPGSPAVIKLAPPANRDDQSDSSQIRRAA